ncbi:hypothetical protein [Lysinibacillus sp. NPDC047702]|uniref:hypothetical protein n=1 Tax=unclassified Lysinibacillus TaxID=2636778 RepID=UPI003D0754D4
MAKFVFACIGSSIAFIIIQIVLQFFVSEDIKKLLTQIGILIFILLLLNPYLSVFKDSSDKSELKMVKGQNAKKRKLFTRIGEEFDTDLFIYEVVGDLDEGVNSLADLKIFKAKIIEKIGPNLKDYYLIREAVDLKLKLGFLNFLSEISKKILISTITVIISSLFITNMIKVINDGESKWGFFILIVQFVNSSLFVLILIHIAYFSFKGMKNRAFLLKAIIDLIISEKEKEGDNNYTIIV